MKFLNQKWMSKVLICLLVFLSLVIYISYDIYVYSKVIENIESDTAVVLGASVWDDKPSPVFEERIKHSIILYKSGIVKNIIFTGGKGENKDYSESIVAKKYAMNNGVLSEHIFIEEKSKITEENIKYAMDIAANENFKSLIIVSDPLHMRRAMDMADEYGMIVYSSPTQSSKIVSFDKKADFLAREVFFYIGYKIIKILK